MTQIFLPDDITDADVALTFTPSGYQKIVALLFQTRTERDTALAEKTNADRRISELIEQGQLKDDQLAKANARVTELTEQAASADEQVLQLNEQLKLATDRVNDQAREIERLQKQPPAPAPDGDDVWPDEPPFSVVGCAAFTVEKGQEAPDKAQYTRVREALAWAWDKKIGIKAWRGHLNLGEVKDHLGEDEAGREVAPPLGNLIEFGRLLRMHFIADTVDVVIKNVDNDTLKWYLQSLETLKARAIVLNDADQYGLDGVKEMIDRARLFTNLPIILSLRGTADVAAFKALGKDVYVEIQSFGSLSELKNTFLKKAAIVDFFCFSAFKALTTSQLKAIYDAVLASPIKPKAFFFYTDRADDWPTMPQAEVDVLKSFVIRWRATL